VKARRREKKSDGLSLCKRNRQSANIAQRARPRNDAKNTSLRKGPRSAIAAAVCTFRGAVPLRSAVIWHDLNDETKYKRQSDAHVRVSREEESQVDTLVFPDRRFSLSPCSLSLSLSFSSLNIFLELQTEKKKFVSIRRKCRGGDCFSAYTSKMYLETQDAEKPRRLGRLVNLTESFETKRNFKNLLFSFIAKNSYCVQG